MRRVELIVIHCSATRECVAYSPAQLEKDHLARGFKQAGYHYYIRRTGEIVEIRPLGMIGAHARGYNRHSVGVCYEGGLNTAGELADTRTPEQIISLHQLINKLKTRFPGALVCGHRDLSPDLNGDGVISPHEWIKGCPGFEVKEEY